MIAGYYVWMFKAPQIIDLLRKFQSDCEAIFAERGIS